MIEVRLFRSEGMVIAVVINMFRLPDFLTGENVMKARWFNNYVCKNEEKLLERLDQAILDVINNPKKTQKTARIGTLL